MPGPFLRPVPHGISSSYDSHRNRRPPSANPGTDFACPMRTPVVAPMDAVVIRVDHLDRTAQGRHIWLRDPRDGAELQMMHFDLPQVSAGQSVRAGQQIGLSGNTGASQGPHLHTSLWFKGRTLDFMNYVTSGAPASATKPNPSTPAPQELEPIGELPMFIAAIPKNFHPIYNGWFLVTDGVAIVLSGQGGKDAKAQGIPVIPFDDQNVVDQLVRKISF